MYNLRWGFISAAAALVVSVILGIIFGVSFSHIVIRALIFFAVFFGLGFGLYFVISGYFPELLVSGNEESADTDAIERPGTRVNITVDSTGEYAVPELYKTSGGSPEMGNIEDLASGAFKPRQENRPGSDQLNWTGIDRMDENGYNDEGGGRNNTNQDSFQFQDTPVFEKDTAAKPAFTPSFGDDMGFGSLPDLDMMAMAFSSGVDSSPGGIPSMPVSPPPVDDFEPARPRYVGSKPQQLEGDFNPKELAEGIRTVLSKDKK